MTSNVTATVKPASRERNASGTSALTLIRAEFGRALRTRSTMVFLAVATVATLAIFTVRVLISAGSEDPLSGDLIVLSADVIGFVAMFSTSLAVARDHQSGAIDLVRVLIPARAKHLFSFGAAHALLSVAVVLVVAIVGTVIVLAVEPSAYSSGFPVDNLGRLLLATALLAFAGAGVGALCRSSALTTFFVLAVYLILPVALMVAGLAGQTWAGAVSDKTLGLLSSVAISNATDAWAAVMGVALWALSLMLLGTVREVKAR